MALSMASTSPLRLASLKTRMGVLVSSILFFDPTIPSIVFVFIPLSPFTTFKIILLTPVVSAVRQGGVSFLSQTVVSMSYAVKKSATESKY